MANYVVSMQPTNDFSNLILFFILKIINVMCVCTFFFWKKIVSLVRFNQWNHKSLCKHEQIIYLCNQRKKEKHLFIMSFSQFYLGFAPSSVRQKSNLCRFCVYILVPFLNGLVQSLLIIGSRSSCRNSSVDNILL